MDEIKWYEQMSYKDAKEIIREKLNNMSRTFIATGYFLRQIRDTEGYKEDGYKDIWEFAEDQYGIKRSTTSRWMAMNEKFSEGGNSPTLAATFDGFGKSQLQEMLYLEDSQLEQVTPEMTVKEIRDVKKPEEKKTLLKPTEEQNQYLKDFARHLITCSHKWFLEKFHERVMNVEKSPEEIKARWGPGHRTWYYATERGVGSINMFDDYVQIWDEKHRYIGDFEWFYLAAAIQTMWNVIALEKAQKETIEKQTNASDCKEVSDQKEENKCLHAPGYFCTLAEAQKVAQGDGVNCHEKCCWNCAKRNECGYSCNACGQHPIEKHVEEQIPGQMQIEDFPEILPENKEKKEVIESAQDLGNPKLNTDLECATSHIENKVVADVEYTEISEEKDEELSVKTDMELLKEMLEKENRMLDQMKECFTDNDFRVRKQCIKVTALAAMLCELDLKEDEFTKEQPEFPKLKNMEEREAFVLNYETWPVWVKNELTEETYYRYDLPDGSAIVVREYPYLLSWRKEESIGTTLFLIKPEDKHFKDGETNMTALKEHLKNVQKGERNGQTK